MIIRVTSVQVQNIFQVLIKITKSSLSKILEGA